jgi:sugar O-acyltransferase (sialic acid O-acetyltransferase NeuD family)
MNKIYIIGNGGFAKEIYFLIKSSTNFEVMGFIDIEPSISKIKFISEEVDVLDEKYFFSHVKNANVCIGIGNPKIIERIYEKYSNYIFPNIIHKSVVMDFQNSKMGRGNIFTAGCVLTTSIEIGNLNIFNLKTTVGHDVLIGNFNVFNPSVNISGCCKIGNTNLFGVGSVVLENLNICNNSILGANSTLIENMTDNAIYVGSPAKLKKYNKI